jgi:hypothetical protein
MIRKYTEQNCYQVQKKLHKHIVEAGVQCTKSLVTSQHYFSLSLSALKVIFMTFN